MTTPPAKDGTIPPERLVAAREAGVNEIYKVGGAPGYCRSLRLARKPFLKVDKIVGTGKYFCYTCKKEIFGYAGIDMLARPSEVLIIADDRANPSFVASDLLSQAEHAPGISILVTFSESTTERVKTELKQQISKLKRHEVTKKCLDKFGVMI